MGRDPNCRAYQSGGQIFCADCGLNWDADDDEPPDCRINPLEAPPPKKTPIRKDDRHPIGGSL